MSSWNDKRLVEELTELPELKGPEKRLQAPQREHSQRRSFEW